ncbi:response regulator [Falsihalocynthiibacter sp. SS001]|uniref:response regulator transcription factor n=1 Tax=Falsihalocynthiibacter sp. SS001 TaxID=3349698 RepID=UPI0036D2AAA0
MKFLVADDHDLVREAIGAFIETEGAVEVCLAADLGETLETIDAKGAFDLVLLDYNMPGMNGLEGLQRAITQNGGKPVALLSGTATRNIAEQAINAGAAGFVPKTLGSKSMVMAAKFMAQGEIFAPFSFMQQMDSMGAKQTGLTQRETQVLRGIAEGKSNKEIARDHNLQEVTVKLHVKTLSRKLEARNRTHAAMIARDRELI